MWVVVGSILVIEQQGISPCKFDSKLEIRMKLAKVEERDAVIYASNLLKS